MSKRNNLGILGNYWGKKGKLKSKRDSFLNNEVIKFRMNIKGESTDIKNKLKLLLSKVHTVSIISYSGTFLWQLKAVFYYDGD